MPKRCYGSPGVVVASGNRHPAMMPPLRHGMTDNPEDEDDDGTRRGVPRSESKQISAFWTTIKDMGNYSKDSVSSERWLSAIRRGSQPSAAAEDSVYARPLALTLLTRLLSVSGGVVAVRRLLWWGLVRELAPYASGRYLPSDSQALDHFCVRRARHQGRPPVQRSVAV
ncbi:uncharacterized protein [Dermacentor andersoni]|uniref:uncharacterized protein n=1 Tax=Dermacentor andersoni TaxID=34620 RepID=UPI003B3A075E